MMPSLTIFEGPDNAGKSTLLTRLLAERNTQGQPEPQLRHSAPDPDLGSHEKFLRYLSWLHIAQFGDVWCDRAWLSCDIYDHVMLGKQRLSVVQRRILERLALTRRVVQVLCLPPYEVCVALWRHRRDGGGEYVEAEDRYRLVYDYYVTAQAPRLPTVRHDWTNPGAIPLTELIETMRPPPNGGPGVGHWRPQNVTLLVGEGPNPKVKYSHLRYLGPFCDTSNQGCSKWLAEQLETALVPEHKLYWVNAYDKTQQVTDHRFIDRLQPLKIIAMGKVAAQWARASGHQFVHVEHPQHWKRFHSKEPYPLLTEVA